MATVAEIAEPMLATVRLAVRVTSALFEPEVEAVAQSAVADLRRVGVEESAMEPGSDLYPLALAAVVVYAKAHFGQDNPNAEMDFWRESYLMHVDALLGSAANRHAREAEGEVEQDG